MKYYILIIISSIYLYGSAQNLEDYVQMALQNNPSVSAAKESVLIAGEKIIEAGSWNNTGISAGVYPLRPETRVGSQVGKLGISQEFPWFGTYKQAKKVAKNQKIVETFNVVLTEKDLRFKVAALYYKMIQLQENIEVLKDNKSILKVYEKMALGALENNKARMSDILRIRAEKNALHAKIYQHIKDLDSYKHALNRLLNRDLDASINLPAHVNATDILPVKNEVSNHPSLAKLTGLKEVYKSQEKWIKKQAMPKFKLGTDYIPVQQRTGIYLPDNGKDVWMISVGLKIPLFTKKYKSQLKQTALKIKQMEFLKENRRLELETAVEQAQADFDKAMVYIMAADKNAKDVQTAIDSDLKAFETGLLDYDRILRLQLQKIKFELQAIENTTKAFIANEKIKYLTD